MAVLPKWVVRPSMVTLWWRRALPMRVAAAMAGVVSLPVRVSLPELVVSPIESLAASTLVGVLWGSGVEVTRCSVPHDRARPETRLG